MSIGKLKRRLFRTKLSARRFEDLRRYLRFGPSIQSPPNARDVAHALVIVRKNVANSVFSSNCYARSLVRILHGKGETWAGVK